MGDNTGILCAAAAFIVLITGLGAGSKRRKKPSLFDRDEFLARFEAAVSARADARVSVGADVCAHEGRCYNSARARSFSLTSRRSGAGKVPSRPSNR